MGSIQFNRELVYRLADRVDELADRIRDRAVATDTPSMPGCTLVAALGDAGHAWVRKTDRYAEAWNEFAGQLDSATDIVETTDDETAAFMTNLL